jgi:hypothetical protein
MSLKEVFENIRNNNSIELVKILKNNSNVVNHYLCHINFFFFFYGFVYNYIL